MLELDENKYGDDAETILQFQIQFLICCFKVLLTIECFAGCSKSSSDSCSGTEGQTDGAFIDAVFKTSCNLAN